VSKKADQVVLSSLRFGEWLKSVSVRLFSGVDKICLCGTSPGTVKLVLLVCNLHAPARQTTLQAERSAYNGTTDGGFLIGGSGVTLDERSWHVIRRAVAKFARNTGGDVWPNYTNPRAWFLVFTLVYIRGVWIPSFMRSRTGTVYTLKICFLRSP